MNILWLIQPVYTEYFTLSGTVLAGLGAAIFDNMFLFVDWPQDYNEVIGVSSQIITGIISLVASIVGIAISLQNEETYGIKVTKLYELRVVKHYSIVEIIIISISLCLINLVFYMLNLTIAALATLIASIIFLVKVVLDEVPLMAKQEMAIKRVIKDNLIICYLENSEARIELKDTIKYLLCRETLNEIYDVFYDKNDEAYNTFLILKLLEYQQDLACEVKDRYDVNQQRIICSSMLENVLDVILYHMELAEQQYEEIYKERHLLTRVLFSINRIPECKDLLASRVSGLFQCLMFKPECKKPNDLLGTMMVTLVAITIKDSDFSIVEAIRRHLSHSEWEITKPSPSLDVFAVISLYLYYLCESEPDVPDKLKSRIRTFIDEGGFIERDTRILSWKTLFSLSKRNFYVDYKSFINLAMKNEHNLEYLLLGIGTKNLVFGEGYLTRWYLVNLLNSNRLHLMETLSALSEEEGIQWALKSLGEGCFDENQNFIITKEMEDIISFYGGDSNPFSMIRIYEKSDNSLFNLINGIKLEDLEKEVSQAKKVENDIFSTRIKDEIELALSKEWGFDNEIKVEGEERYFSLLLEKYPEHFGFEKVIMDYCVESVFNDLKNHVKKSIIRKNRFANEIEKILTKRLKYITKFAKYNIPHYYLNDEKLQEKYMSICNHLTEFESKLLGNSTIITEEEFSFNCIVDRVEIRELNQEELSKQVKKHQREDGQYVFNGVFLPKEKITQMIKDKFAVLTVIIRHKIKSSEETIFELRPYSFEEDDGDEEA